MPSVIPSAKSLTLCDAVATREGGRTTLHGLFNSLRIVTFPYSLGHFCAFAQLSHGLGEVETHFEVSEVGADTPLYVTSPRRIEFPNRDFLIQLAVETNKPDEVVKWKDKKAKWDESQKVVEKKP